MSHAVSADPTTPPIAGTTLWSTTSRRSDALVDGGNDAVLVHVLHGRHDLLAAEVVELAARLTGDARGFADDTCWAAHSLAASLCSWRSSF
jgi:hypothetical protein